MSHGFLRVIARLDIKGPNLVKGIRLEGLRVLGKPQDFARWYYEEGADELLYMDAVASLYGRNSLLNIVEKTAREVFIPLTVGGGIRTVDDIRSALRAGADKVAINTAAVQRPEFIREASRKFGSSTIVVSIEAIRKSDGTYEAYTDYGRQSSGIDAYEWALRTAELGAGELMITAIDRDGTGHGFDLELTRRIAEALSIPVIACGGGGRLDHIETAVAQGSADAVCLSSILHYHYVKRYTYRHSDFFEEGNTEYLRREREFQKVQAVSLPEIKAFLVERGIPTRPVAEILGER